MQKKTGKLKTELFELLAENPVAKSKKKTGPVFSGKFSPADFDAFVQKKKAVVNAIIKLGHFSNTNIHTIRKNLKDLFYCFKIYETVDKDILQQHHWKKKEAANFDHFLKELGEYQDKCTAITLLKSYWLRQLSIATRLQLEQVKKKWITERNNLKKPVVKKLKESIPVMI